MTHQCSECGHPFESPHVAPEVCFCGAVGSAIKPIPKPVKEKVDEY